MTLRQKHTAAYAAAMLSLMILQILFYVKPFSTLSDYHREIVYTLLSQILCMGVIPLSVLLVLRRGERIRDVFSYMRYAKPIDWKSCLLASFALMLLITPFTMVFNAATNIFLNIIGYKRAAYVGTVYAGFGDYLLFVVITALLPAVFEEFSHRGLLLSGLENRGSELSAVLLSALCFGLMHENPLQMIYAFFGGLVFGLSVTKTKSMIPAMCAHFANNFVATTLEYSSQTKNALGVFYEKLTASSNLLFFFLTVAVMILSVYAVIKVLQYLARKTEKPVSEKKLFGVIVTDAYKKDGKATLKDNAFLLSVIIAETALLLALIVWGIVR